MAAFFLIFIIIQSTSFSQQLSEMPIEDIKLAHISIILRIFFVTDELLQNLSFSLSLSLSFFLYSRFIKFHFADITVQRSIKLQTTNRENYA